MTISNTSIQGKHINSHATYTSTDLDCLPQDRDGYTTWTQDNAQIANMSPVPSFEGKLLRRHQFQN